MRYPSSLRLLCGGVMGACLLMAHNQPLTTPTRHRSPATFDTDEYFKMAKKSILLSVSGSASRDEFEIKKAQLHKQLDELDARWGKQERCDAQARRASVLPKLLLFSITGKRGTKSFKLESASDHCRMAAQHEQVLKDLAGLKDDELRPRLEAHWERTKQFLSPTLPALVEEMIYSRMLCNAEMAGDFSTASLVATQGGFDDRVLEFTFGEDSLDNADGVPAALRCIQKMSYLKSSTPEGTPLRPKLMMMGYSNGGRATVELLSRIRSSERKWDLVFTVDPVVKIPEMPFQLLTFGLANRWLLKRTVNARRWINFYQREALIKGNIINGADLNERIHYLKGNKYAHVEISYDDQVLDRLRKEIDAILEPSENPQ